MFNQVTGQTLIKKPGDIDGVQFAIRYLSNCHVSVFDYTGQFMVDQCKNSTLVIGPVRGSIFVRDCENMTIHVACQQFRCRDLKNCTIYLFAQNDPVIEASSGLRFAPFNIAYPCLRQHAEKAQLDVNLNKWELIFDFSNIGLSNFSTVPPAEWKIQVCEIEGFEQKAEVVFDYPKRYGGTQSDKKPQ